MKLYIADAFTDAAFGGNPAGVLMLDRELDESVMQKLATELRYSETAFVSTDAECAGTFDIRYFTPAMEVDLCGHATVATFTALSHAGHISDGEYTARTKAGKLSITVANGVVWMDMARPEFIGALDNAETAEVCRAYGIGESPMDSGFMPEKISTGLPDIMLRVKDESTLNGMVQDIPAVIALSKRHSVTGVHAFCLSSDGAAAHCRNFAPLYEINEEAATGTSNGALTYYLYRHGLIEPGAINRFVQGEAMGRPSEILTTLYEEESGVRIRVGGRGTVLVDGAIEL